ncbi:MAG: cysteine--tRNA ligase [Euryarchaeota archaeon]|nr:cysteine--tRNA ligase [Euryarchaeota archaeon]|tara:strand:+ start:16559 stop:18043 length:1485 start_codon:yes stop_codon:yes gene_type:complete
MAQRIYNTLSGKRENLESREKGKLHIYVCGPTVYDYSHLGHARVYVVFDVIRRYLEHSGNEVIYINNLTDVNDKIIKRAEETGDTPESVAERFSEEFFIDMDSLGVKRADFYPKVSEHITEITGMIAGLVEKGYAYESAGDVYFNTSKVNEYGKLSRQNLEKIIAGIRVDANEKKKNQEDFALWKSAGDNEQGWDSPWGRGRPGWHIECSAMAMKYFGESLDIHGGGQDLVFPHHENEIAQSEAYSGKEFAKYWMHNGFVTVDKEKMGKSLGNFFTVREILKKHRPEVVRYFLLSTQYRKPIDFTEEAINEAKSSLEGIENSLSNLKHAITVKEGTEKTKDDKEVLKKIDYYRTQFFAAMDDDFNTREAISSVHQMCTVLNSYIVENPNNEVLREALDNFEEFSQILNLFEEQDIDQNEEIIAHLRKLMRELEVKKLKDDYTVSGLMRLVLLEREKARKENDYEKSDKIREGLSHMGIVIEDTEEGPRWQFRRS